MPNSFTQFSILRKVVKKHRFETMKILKKMYPPVFQNTGITRRLPNPVILNRILRKSEYEIEAEHKAESCVQKVQLNHLAANSPSEDRIAISTIIDRTGTPVHIWSVLDGHGGGHCANTVTGRLHQCLTMAMVNEECVERCFQSHWSNAAVESADSLQRENRIKCMEAWRAKLNENHMHELNEELIELCFSHIDEWAVNEALDAMTKVNHCPIKMNIGSYLKTDSGESTEANVHGDILMAGLSGACAAVVVLKNNDAFIAIVGDCSVILGYEDEHKTFKGNSIIEAHNYHNDMERNRVLSAHPEIERSNLVYNQRLLGCLMPFRAFGDLKFKIEKCIMDDLFVPYFGSKFKPIGYRTPPYLTAKPEVRRVKIEANNTFMVLCSDGLTDGLEVEDIAYLVQGYCRGQTLKKAPFKRHEDTDILYYSAERKPVTFKIALEVSEKRKQDIKRTTGYEGVVADENVATHLIRHCVARNPHHIDYKELAFELCHPRPREVRDDISAAVIFLNRCE